VIEVPERESQKVSKKPSPRGATKKWNGSSEA